jgi:hypothetical protein
MPIAVKNAKAPCSKRKKPSLLRFGSKGGALDASITAPSPPLWSTRISVTPVALSRASAWSRVGASSSPRTTAPFADRPSQE